MLDTMTRCVMVAVILTMRANEFVERASRLRDEGKTQAAAGFFAEAGRMSNLADSILMAADEQGCGPTARA